MIKYFLVGSEKAAFFYYKTALGNSKGGFYIKLPFKK
jgi:hypothetical protein